MLILQSRRRRVGVGMNRSAREVKTTFTFYHGSREPVNIIGEELEEKRIEVTEMMMLPSCECAETHATIIPKKR